MRATFGWRIFPLLVFAFENPGGVEISTNPYGVNLAQNSEGGRYVSDLVFRSMSEEAGLDYGDFVTAVDLEQGYRPPKKRVCVPTMLLLTLLLFLQQRRRARI